MKSSKSDGNWHRSFDVGYVSLKDKLEEKGYPFFVLHTRWWRMTRYYGVPTLPVFNSYYGKMGHRTSCAVGSVRNVEFTEFVIEAYRGLCSLR